MADIYLTVQRFRAATVLRDVQLSELERNYPEFLTTNIELISREIEERLRHKYAIPFPERHATIEKWIIGLLQPLAAAKIGIEPNDSIVNLIEKRADLVEEQLKDAAAVNSPNATNWNLPIKDAKDQSGIVKGGPFGYGEHSPYDWTDRQIETVGRDRG